jgi:predicted DNA-binding protein
MLSTDIKGLNQIPLNDLLIFKKIGGYRMAGSRLEKYRRPKFGMLTKQYNIKLPDDLAEELERACSELNMTPAEFIRLLIYEEVQELKRMKISKDTLEYPRGSGPIQKTKPNQKKEKRFTYKPWEVDEKLPCVVCEKWYHSSTFSARHAKAHGFIDTKSYFVKNIEEINKMYKDLTGNTPKYDAETMK